ncbi:hypothetical protein AU468_10650 [Alkalispirochaeta sphaeroplastigenens]|uniref:CdiI immunity protein domain-containing protein n=1 Tax=Alkalispirochaeta sphaeroplastigenens TaxID=1187066 RepID=A0A2S4JHX6_9SPIO|nr:hypothetical protein [Alkalispirochaeta sphaeroplastigenens]POQ99069.1 hypothetical protein AU468_10650 [Alkalispirochaeta sphaeroplastigenens]
MFHSQKFLTQCRKVPLQAFLSAGTEQDQLESLFARFLGAVPRELARDLLDHTLETAGTRDEAQQKLADLVDLFWLQYDDAADPLTFPDWELLRETVNTWAQELDIDLVQYIMERVLTHKAL